MLRSMKSVNLHLQRCLCRRKVYKVHEKSGNQLPTSRNGIKKDSTRNSRHLSQERVLLVDNETAVEAEALVLDEKHDVDESTSSSGTCGMCS